MYVSCHFCRFLVIVFCLICPSNRKQLYINLRYKFKQFVLILPRDNSTFPLNARIICYSLECRISVNIFKPLKHLLKTSKIMLGKPRKYLKYRLLNNFKTCVTKYKFTWYLFQVLNFILFYYCDIYYIICTIHIK